MMFGDVEILKRKFKEPKFVNANLLNRLQEHYYLLK
jgi:hypothetical protein